MILNPLIDADVAGEKNSDFSDIFRTTFGRGVQGGSNIGSPKNDLLGEVPRLN